MAIKTFKYFDAGIELRDQGADNASVEGQVYQNAGKLKAYIGAAIREIVTNSQSQTLTNKTFNAPDNTLTNISDANISNTASIAKYKIAAGTVNALQANSGTGVISDVNDILVTTNEMSLASSKHLAIQNINDNTTTGTNATLNSFTGGSVRLTNASLVSIANIPAGNDGQDLVLVNRTGVNVTIVDSSSVVGTAANRIFTGNNSDSSLPNNASLHLRYDSGSSRWQVLGMIAVAAVSSPPLFQWNINGALLTLGSKSKRVDGSVLYGSITPTAAKVACKKVGTAGTFTVDVRKHQSLNTPILSILPLYQASVSSVANVTTSIATQSIAAHTTAINTQSITRAKSTLSIQSIIKIQGTNQWKYNFSGSLLDSDYQVGNSILVASASNAANNGTFTIVEVNHGNFPSLVVTNASGVAQTSAAGTVDLQLFSYNYSSAVSSDYVAGDNFLAASHTTGANNGSFTIYKLNQSGNNIWVYNASGVTQAGVAGTANTYLWRYSYSSAVNTTYFVVGQRAKMASHTTGANNGNFPIREVNVAGNNIVVYNTAGAAQAGIAGNALPNLWVVNFSTNPTSFISVGHNVKVEGSSTTANNGTFQALSVAANYVVVYNESGVAQATSGTFYTCRYKVTLNSTAASLNITTSSIIEMLNTASTTFEETDLDVGYNVLAIGTSDLTIEDTAAVLADFQSSPAGFISIESKSILTSPSSIVASTVGSREKELQSSTTLPIAGTIDAGTWLGVWVTSNFTAGYPKDASIILY
jgi:hypothetical protein